MPLCREARDARRYGESEREESVMAKRHLGFKRAQSDIAKRQGISEDRAGAILAAGTRKASAAAKRRNPRLKRVKG